MFLDKLFKRFKNRNTSNDDKESITEEITTTEIKEENKEIVINETNEEEKTTIEVDDKHNFGKVRPTLKFGDIIYASHYYNERTRTSMPYPSETGPYVVIGFDGVKIIGVPCIFAEYHGDIILGEDYRVFRGKRKGYISFNRIRAIDNTTFVSSFSGKLNNKDIAKIRKRLALNKAKKYDDYGCIKIYKHNFKDKFNVGDFVSSFEYKELGLLVNRIDSDTFEFLPIKQHNRRSSFIDFDKADIDYSQIVEVKANELAYCNTINQSQVTKIVEKCNEYKTIKNRINNDGNHSIAKGNLIYYKDGIYYVYDIYGTTASAYKVVIEDSEHSFKIGDLSCKPYHKKAIKLSIYNNYHIIGKANTIEMDSIKTPEIEKDNQDKEIEKIISMRKTYYSKGSIMAKVDDSTQEYIIRDQLYGTYRVIDVKELIDNKKIIGSIIPIRELYESTDISSDRIDTITNTLDELGETNLSQEIKNRVLI